MSTALKIVDLQQLQMEMAIVQEHGGKVVFTNGCFDILHLGHIDYLEKARALGDKLVVAVNTDTSVEKLKGPQRPINDQLARTRMLAALSFVDFVILFGEDTPYELIKSIKPDILVKGSDYLAEDIVGADIVIAKGGQVKTIDLVSGFSTTKLIENIKRS